MNQRNQILGIRSKMEGKEPGKRRNLWHRFCVVSRGFTNEEVRAFKRHKDLHRQHVNIIIIIIITYNKYKNNSKNNH